LPTLALEEVLKNVLKSAGCGWTSVDVAGSRKGFLGLAFPGLPLTLNISVDVDRCQWTQFVGAGNETTIEPPIYYNNYKDFEFHKLLMELIVDLF
jgi:hypothetical protein